MKKIYLTLITFLVLFSGVNALSVSINQDENIFAYGEDLKGNRVTEVLSGNTDTLGVFLELTNATVPYDYKLELDDVNEDFYIIIDNFLENQTYTFFYTDDLNTGDTVFIRNITMLEVGKYYYAFTPTNKGEYAAIWIDMQTGGSPGVFGIDYQETKPEGFNELIAGLVRAFEEIIDVNVSLWRVLYYLFAFIITFSFVAMIFGTAFWLFGLAKRAKKQKVLHITPDDSEDRKPSRREEL